MESFTGCSHRAMEATSLRLSRSPGMDLLPVVFAFLHSQQMQYPYPQLLLKGLDPSATYRIRSISGKLAPGAPLEASGAYWMGQGLDIQLVSDYDAAAFVLDRK